MRLNTIVANHHIFAGRVNGKPMQLQLTFEGGKALRLRVGADGEEMLADRGPLDVPSDLGEYGQTGLADVTASISPTLQGSEVSEVEALITNGKQVGVRLTVKESGTFHFWVDGDELHWGDQAALQEHPWCDGAVPKACDTIQV